MQWDIVAKRYEQLAYINPRHHIMSELRVAIFTSRHSKIGFKMKNHYSFKKVCFFNSKRILEIMR
jgi:hypothetical protein